MLKPCQTKEKVPNWKSKGMHQKKKKRGTLSNKESSPISTNHKMGVAKEQPKSPKPLAWKTNMTQGKAFGCFGRILGKTRKANKVPWMYLRQSFIAIRSFTLMWGSHLAWARKAQYYSHKVWEGAEGKGPEHNYH